MSERMLRIARKQAREAARFVSNDEQLTRQRVDRLEVVSNDQIGTIDKLVDYTAKTEALTQELANWRAHSTLWQRLRWLFTGR